MRSRRRSVVVSAAAVLLVAVLATYAAEDPAPKPSEGLILKYDQTEGDRASYEFSVSGTAKLNLQQGLTTERMDISMQAKCVEEFWEPTPEGLAQVQGAFMSGTMKAKSQGEEHGSPLQRMVVNYKIAPSGEMKERELLSGELTGLAGLPFAFGPDDAFLVGGLVQFPKKPLKPGDKWKGTVAIPSEETGAAVLVNYESKALGLEQYRGRPCVKIATSAKEATETTVPDEESGGIVTFKGTAKETVTWRFDYERGLVMSSEGVIQITATGSFVDEEAREHTATMSGVLNTRSVMTEFNGQKLSAN
jgi:hypothetical protein